MNVSSSMDIIHELEPICQRVGKSFSTESLAAFVSELDQMPNQLANSTDSFHSKLIAVCEAGLFTTLNAILHNLFDTKSQLKLLRFWDFLISSCSKPEELSMLFQDDVTNNVILYPYDFNSTDVLRSFLTVCKGLSMKANKIDVHHLFTSDQNDLPLYSHTIPFIASKDSIVVAASRCVVLNLFLIKDPAIQAFLSEKNSRAPLEYLIKSIDGDGLDFLNDFLCVAPRDLKEFVTTRLETKLMNCEIELLARAVSYLASSSIKSMLTRVISARIHSFPIDNPVTLGLLLFGIEKKLILLDSAIKYGLISDITINSFGQQESKRCESNYIDEINEVFKQRSTSVQLVTCLRIYQLLYKDPPDIIAEVGRDIIQEIRLLPASSIMPYFLNHIGLSQRTDLDYLLDSSNFADMPKGQTLLKQLNEILVVLGKYRNDPFKGFDFIEAEEKGNQEFGTTDGKSVFISPNYLSVDDKPQYKLSKCVVDQTAKQRKYVLISVFAESEKNRRRSLTVPKSEELRIEFASTNVASNFITEIDNYQKAIISSMLDTLPL